MTPFARLEELPFAFHVGRGRLRLGEPLWAVALFREDADGLAKAYDDPDFLIEGDSLEYCVTRAEAFALGLIDDPEKREKS